MTRHVACSVKSSGEKRAAWKCGGVALGLGCNIKSAFCKGKRKKSEIREMQKKEGGKGRWQK